MDTTLGIALATTTTVTAAVLAIFPGARKPFMWLWRVNVTYPLRDRHSRRLSVLRHQVTAEVVDNIDGQLRDVIRTELKQRNGGASLVDISEQLVKLETGQRMLTERVQEVGRKAESAAVKADYAAGKAELAASKAEAAHKVMTEAVAEQAALSDAARDGTLERRKKA